MKGSEVRVGHRLDGYRGGTFLVATVDAHPHRTSAGETARSAYDAAGRGLVLFCGDDYPTDGTP